MTRPDPGLRRMALCGVLAPLTLAGAALLTGALNPGTSHARQFLSELGATGAPYAWIMNVFGLVLTGVLLIGFGIAVHRALGPGAIVALGAALLALMGLALSSAGLFSCDPGCAETGWSTEATIHAWSGLTGSLAAALAPIVVGVGLRSRRPLRGYALFSIADGIVVLALIAAMIVDGSDSPWRGAWQRGFLAVFFVWTVTTAAGIANAATAGPEASARS